MQTSHPVLHVVLVASLATASYGCVENDASIFVQQVQVLDKTTCGATASPSDAALAGGLIDVAFTNSYDAALLMGNQLVKRGNTNTFRLETSHVQFTEAEVEVFDFGGGSIGAFSVPISGFAEAASGNSPGYGLAFVTLIDPASAAALPIGQTVVSRVKVFGESLGGADVESGFFDYPINVCEGCTIACPMSLACDEDPTDCPCEIGQDFEFDCRCFRSTNPCP